MVSRSVVHGEQARLGEKATEAVQASDLVTLGLEAMEEERGS